MDDLEQVEVRSEAALWDWLEAHHGQAASVWLVTWKAARRDFYVSREAVLDALLAYGWIDGRRKDLDAERTMQLIAPRQQQAWAQSYKDRVARLEAAGRMRPAGQAAVEAGKVSGLWSFFDDVDQLEVPLDLADAMGALGEAWDGLAPSYRRNVLRWLKLAKTDATRTKRIAAIMGSLQKGEKLPQM